MQNYWRALRTAVKGDRRVLIMGERSVIPRIVVPRYGAARNDYDPLLMQLCQMVRKVPVRPKGKSVRRKSRQRAQIHRYSSTNLVLLKLPLTGVWMNCCVQRTAHVLAAL